MGVRIQWEGTSSGPRPVSGTEDVLGNEGPHCCCHSFPFRPGPPWAVASLLLAAVQETLCPGTLPVVPAWPDIHPGPLYASLGEARLPSNLFTHIPFKTDSGPSEQLPSLDAEVFSHL